MGNKWRFGATGIVACVRVCSECAEAHIACAAIQSKTINPGARTVRPYLQIETGAIVMQADLSERADLCFGELLNKPRHEKSPVGDTHVPQRPYTSRKY